MPAKEDKGNAVLAVHFILESMLTVVRLITRWSISVVRVGVTYTW